jgi:hypothetical protein
MHSHNPYANIPTKAAQIAADAWEKGNSYTKWNPNLQEAPFNKRLLITDTGGNVRIALRTKPLLNHPFAPRFYEVNFNMIYEQGINVVHVIAWQELPEPFSFQPNE